MAEREPTPVDKPEAKPVNKRGAARMGAVQALYQMDVSGAGLAQTVAEYENFRLGREIDGAQYREADPGWFRQIMSGVHGRQVEIDRLIAASLVKGWPLSRIDATLRAILRCGVLRALLQEGRARPRRHQRVRRHRPSLLRDGRAADGQRRPRPDRPPRARGRASGQARRRGVTAERSGEFDWIARHFAPLAGEGSFGLRDDAATFEATGRVVLTQDTIVEGIHFFLDDPPEDVARKAVRVNVSDIVAKGATPRALLLSLGVPDRWMDEDVAAFAAGLGSDLERYGITLLGGDTVRSPERLTVTITMLGDGAHVTRMGAKPGDVLCVSGPIGDATLGLAPSRHGRCARAAAAPARSRSICKRCEIVARIAHASMDVSDGLIGDAEKLCAASGVGATIELSRMPVSEEAAALGLTAADLVAMATGGDDYVVLCAVPPGATPSGFHDIGRIVEGEGVGVTLDGVPVEIGSASYTHD